MLGHALLHGHALCMFNVETFIYPHGIITFHGLIMTVNRSSVLHGSQDIPTMASLTLVHVHHRGEPSRSKLWEIDWFTIHTPRALGCFDVHTSVG